MAGQSTSKVRLVRCPGCRGILPELAPVYQCAACGTVLQAKKRKNDTLDTGSHLHETDAAKRNELEHVSDEQIAQSASQEETCASTGELLLDKNFGSDRSETGDSNEEKSRETNFSIELSTELAGHMNEESSHPVKAETGFDQDECPLEQTNEGDQNESGDCNVKRPERASFSDEVASTELNHHKSEELSSPVARDHSEEDFKQYSGRNQNEHGYCNGKQLGGANFSDGVASSFELNHHESEEPSPLAGVYSEVDDSQNFLEQSNGRNQTEFGDHEGEGPRNAKFSDEFPSSTELTRQEIEDSPPVVGTSMELDGNFKSHFIIGSLSEENLQDSIITAQRPSSESISMESQMSPHSEQLKQSQERTLSGFDHIISEDTLEDFALSEQSPEFSLQFKDLPKYPTSGSYSAYDGSVSSYDGTDYQVPYPIKRKFKKAECAIAKSMPIKDEVEVRYQARNSSSVSSQQKHYAIQGSKCREDELVESTRCGHPVRSRMKSETDEPFYSRVYSIGSENASSSNNGRSVLQGSTSFDLPSKPRYPEDEKMKLLKMVYELQEQLNRTNILRSRAEEIFPRDTEMEKQIPSYYGHVVPEVGIRHDLDNTMHPGSYNQGRNLTHQRQPLHIPFSAEPTVGRHQVDCSCFHGYPQDCNCLAPLPSQIRCSNSQYTALPKQKYFNNPSTSSSPQHYTGSEFSLRSHDVMSDEYRHAYHYEGTYEGKMSSGKRHQPVKRQVLPLAGGAPFLVCYKCSELLQLPADFLLFGKRCHRLRCSACSVILKFSLQNGSHILPYIYPNSLAPSPSNNVEPMSCSDDCGPSWRQSCSTEEEPFSTGLPLSALNRESNDRKMSSGSSFEPMEEREKLPIFEEPQIKYESPAKLYASPESSWRRSKAKKLSSEIEDLPPKSGFPLHKLLGYASPSEVLDSW
ncbi:hypothetical protein Vadar_000575 [Vaccinium darrowii]|uniref:Uncharacterized protein n=1 Tax=Vaccinium darrowii TaxID=229202 RepID=A0ACB7YI79_9ERIC|nr:hypothetical protein Vadar_000575 [Vaccinium darrowii]